MRRFFILAAVMAAVACAARGETTLTLTVPANNTNKTVNIVGEPAIREMVTVVLVGPTNLPHNLRMAIVDGDTTMAASSNFTAAGTATNTTRLDLNTVALTNIFSGRRAQARVAFDLLVWDTAITNLIVNDRIALMNNPNPTNLYPVSVPPSYVETDPVFAYSVAGAITATQVTNWNLASSQSNAVAQSLRTYSDSVGSAATNNVVLRSAGAGNSITNTLYISPPAGSPGLRVNDIYDAVSGAGIIGTVGHLRYLGAYNEIGGGWSTIADWDENEFDFYFDVGVQGNIYLAGSVVPITALTPRDLGEGTPRYTVGDATNQWDELFVKEDGITFVSTNSANTNTLFVTNDIPYWNTTNTALLTNEVDPHFSTSVAANITADMTNSWNTLAAGAGDISAVSVAGGILAGGAIVGHATITLSTSAVQAAVASLTNGYVTASITNGLATSVAVSNLVNAHTNLSMASAHGGYPALWGAWSNAVLTSVLDRAFADSATNTAAHTTLNWESVHGGLQLASNAIAGLVTDIVESAMGGYATNAGTAGAGYYAMSNGAWTAFTVGGSSGSETDPVFTNWVETNAYVKAENDPIWTGASNTFSASVRALAFAAAATDATAKVTAGTNEINGVFDARIKSGWRLTDDGYFNCDIGSVPGSLAWEGNAANTARWHFYDAISINDLTSAGGPPPITIEGGTTMCPGLNADLLDGNHAESFLTSESDPAFTNWVATNTISADALVSYWNPYLLTSSTNVTLLTNYNAQALVVTNASCTLTPPAVDTNRTQTIRLDLVAGTNSITFAAGVSNSAALTIYQGSTTPILWDKPYRQTFWTVRGLR